MTSSTDLFRLSPVPMWISDVQTSSFMEVNEAAIKKFGYSRDVFLSMRATDIQEDIELLKYQCVLTDARTATMFDKEMHAIVDVQDRHVIVELDSNVISYDNRMCDLVVVTDITARIDNELKSRESVERFNIMSKATSDTIWDCSLAQMTVTWNKGIKGIFGYQDIENNITNSEWFQSRIHPEDIERVKKTLADDLTRRNTRWKAHYRFRCADGSYKHVSDRGFVIFDHEGKASRIVGAMEDISQRREEEHWLKLLESVVINTTDGVIIVTRNEVTQEPGVIFANKAFQQMSGYAQSEILGQSPAILHGRNTDKDQLKKLHEAFLGQECCSMELINYNKQGQEYWVSINITPVTDSTDNVTHWISIQRDINESRKYMRAIEEQNKKFKEIAWIQSHIVRAPLARVLGLVDLLKDQRPGDEAAELIEHLTNSAKDLDTIINKIADKTPTINVN